MAAVVLCVCVCGMRHNGTRLMGGMLRVFSSLLRCAGNHSFLHHWSGCTQNHPNELLIYK